MTQSMECPQCHLRTESRRVPGWRGRQCPSCGGPLVLAPAPAERLVRRYLRQQRDAPPPQRAAGPS
ncbi:MAG TPA: hypothetical protein VFJ61_09745 [Solirubrobacterales bacterium]|nr:hypothetical protein [Solirubrobacterales bacterium]